MSGEGDIFHSTAGNAGEADGEEEEEEFNMESPGEESGKEEPLEEKEEAVDNGGGDKGEKDPMEELLSKGARCGCEEGCIHNGIA